MQYPQSIPNLDRKSNRRARNYCRDNIFLLDHASVQKSITLIDKTEHIAYVFYSQRKSTTPGEQKELIHFNLLNSSLFTEI